MEEKGFLPLAFPGEPGPSVVFAYMLSSRRPLSAARFADPPDPTRDGAGLWPRERVRG
jgi:hypothetical protein